MYITYNLDVDDLVAMTLHTLKSSVVWRRQQRNGRIVLAVVTTLLCLGITLLVPHSGVTPLNIGLAIATGIFIYALYPRLTQPTIKKRLVQFYQSDSASGAVGTYSLALDEDGITQSMQTGRRTYSWDQVERLDDTANYLFLFAGKSNCIPVPKKSVDIQDITKLIEAAKAHSIAIRQIP